MKLLSTCHKLGTLLDPQRQQSIITTQSPALKSSKLSEKEKHTGEILEGISNGYGID